MRLEKYTLECRVFGQAKRAQTRCECTALTKPIEILAISWRAKRLRRAIRESPLRCVVDTSIQNTECFYN